MESRVLPAPSGRNRIQWLRVASAGALCVLLAAALPALWLVVKAGAGLLVLVTALLLGAAGLRVLPLLGERLERQLLRARLASAREQPVEELMAQLLHRSEQLQRYRSALTAIAAQIEGMRGMLEQRQAQAGEQDVSRQAPALDKMRAFHAHHVQRLAEAEQALRAFKQHVEQARFEWSFVQAGQRALQGLRSSGRETCMQELLESEAGRSLQQHFDEVFASLELELATLEQLPPTAATRITQGGCP